MPDDRVILCLNSGSSSRKIALFRLGQSAEELLAEGAAEEIGSRAGRLWIRDGGKRTLCDYEHDFSGPADPLIALFDEIDRLQLPRPDAAGHRMVHGGRASYRAGANHARGDQGAAAYDPVRFAPSSRRARRHRGHTRAISGLASGGVLRHRFPSADARGGRALRAAECAEGRRNSALRLSRYLV